MLADLFDLRRRPCETDGALIARIKQTVYARAEARDRRIKRIGWLCALVLGASTITYTVVYFGWPALWR